MASTDALNGDGICNGQNGPPSQNQATPVSGDAPRTFFSSSPSSISAGGKASDQPKRISLSPEEIEAIMLGGCI